MVSKAIDEGLVRRIQRYVANDINSKIVMGSMEKHLEVKPEDIYIVSFERILNNWTALATAEEGMAGFYRLVHDGTHEMTIVTIYLQQGLQQAII